MSTATSMDDCTIVTLSRSLMLRTLRTLAGRVWSKLLSYQQLAG
jgi:hypothetical protein